MCSSLMSAFLLMLSLCNVEAIPCLPPRHLDGLLPNGDFGKAPLPSNLKGTQIIGRDSLPKWEISGVVDFVSGGSRGSHAVKLGKEGSISQRVSVQRDSSYSLTFGLTRSCGQEEVVRVSAESDGMGRRREVFSDDITTQTLYSSDGRDFYGWGFYSDSNRVIMVRFHNTGIRNDSNCGPVIYHVAIKEILPIKFTKGNLVINGDFESGPHVFKNFSTGVLIPSPKTFHSSPALPIWIIGSLKLIRYIDSRHFCVPSGKAAVELVGGREGTLAQMIRTDPYKSYEVVFKIGDAKNGCHGSMIIEAFAGNGSVKAQYVSVGKGRFKQARFRFQADDIITMIKFYSSFDHTKLKDVGHICGPVLDDVRVYPIDPID